MQPAEADSEDEIRDCHDGAIECFTTGKVQNDRNDRQNPWDEEYGPTDLFFEDSMSSSFKIIAITCKV